ncbi:methyltransferase [Parafrankia sp. EUN1f]|uniref:methyltransferase n=1 Tax=Parafrankia sp. EUN1f TaxID=102897 RepID=UPI0001C44637|nr:methyltransferase [Parafrankia sp. EUN1f]EFC85492.1 O-methyltransferase family 2 [Parafrankia sp. EUN1f]
MTTDSTSARTLIELATGYWRTQAIHAAAALGIADRLAGGPRNAADLAAELALQVDPVTRLLRFLVDLDVLTYDSAGGYSLTPVGELLRSDTADSLNALTILYGSEFYAAWGELLNALTTGISGFEKVFGRSLFDYLPAHSETASRYDATMAGGASFFARVPAAHAFPAQTTVVDVAGGTGGLLAEILRSDESLRGVLYDAQHVVGSAATERNLQPFGNRCQTVSGDFFARAPKGGDAYVLSRILHGFDDADCRRILGRIHEAARPGATLLVVERLLPPAGAAPSLAAGFDLHMLAVMGHGRERSRESYAELLAEEGFALDDARPLELDVHLLVARRL